jgi:hypothetical protein
MAELRRTSVCWHTGLPPWRADLAAAAKSLQDIVHVIRAPCDPERGGADKGEGRNWGSDWKKVAKRSVDDCYEDINALMSDGRARTFNAICVELYDKTSNILWKKNPDHALWLLVEDEVLKWTCTAPILFFAAVMEDDVKDRSICMHCSKDFEYEIGTEDGEFCAACLVRIRDGAEEEAEELSKRAIDLEEERDDLHAQVSELEKQVAQLHLEAEKQDAALAEMAAEMVDAVEGEVIGPGAKTDRGERIGPFYWVTPDGSDDGHEDAVLVGNIDILGVPHHAIFARWQHRHPRCAPPRHLHPRRRR